MREQQGGGDEPVTVASMERSAVLSPDLIYRYELHRVWNPDLPRVAWIMLNPSTADAEQDDATIRRCIGFADAWGYGGIVVRNLFALRATDPRQLRDHPDPIGPDNAMYLRDGITHGGPDGIVVCAWGAHGALHQRGPRLLESYTECGAVLHHLGLTKAGHPRHPLYLPSSATPVPWSAEQAPTERED